MSRCGITARINIYAVLSIIVPFVFYLLTLAPSVTFFDSGEFLTAIHSLGSPHSPGYPLFVLFCKPFTWIPFGNIAFRINIATAVSAAMACYGVYLLVTFLLAAEHDSPGIEEADRQKLKNLNILRNSAALSASLTFAFSSRLWLQSNHDKPYPLLAFLAAMILYLILLWRRSYRNGYECPGYLFLCVFLCGLSFGAHQSMVLLIPSYVWLVLSADWRLVKRIKEQILACSFFLFGLSVYLYLPIRATTNPLLNWGDPKTSADFMWHFLRKGYPMEKVERDFNLLWKQISAFNLTDQFTIVGVALMAAGMIAFARKNRDEVVAFAIAVCTFLAVLVGYQNTPAGFIFLTEEFFTPLYLLAAVFIGLGLFTLVEKTVKELVIGKKIVSIGFAMAVILLTLPSVLCALNFNKNNQRDNYIAFDYASNTFRSLDHGAVLLTWGDSGAFPLWYLQGVEKVREDLTLLHIPHLAFEWYRNAFPELLRRTALTSLPSELKSPDNLLRVVIEEQIFEKPVYIDFSTKHSVKLDDYRLHQNGICYKVQKQDDAGTLLPDSGVWSFYNPRGLTGHKPQYTDVDTTKAILIYAWSHIDAGRLLMSMNQHKEGYAELKLAEALAPELALQVKQVEAGYR